MCALNGLERFAIDYFLVLVIVVLTLAVLGAIAKVIHNIID